MWIIIIIVFYLLVAGFTHRTMLTYNGYKSFHEIAHNDGDAPLIVFGSIFWPVTALLYAGMIISRKMTEKYED